MSKGSEESFNVIATELAKNTKAYEDKRIKHYQWADQIDVIFASYGWTKAAFYKELNVRLGIETNESRRAVAEEKEKKKKVKSKKLPTV